VLLVSLTEVVGLGCPCTGGLVFAPYTGPGRYVVPQPKPIETSVALLLENYIATNLNGVYSSAFYQQPSDLSDYAYENAKIMALEGAALYSNWPESCGSNGGSACNWLFYKNNREYFIQDVHSIDFSSTGFPLQDQAGGKGYCVQNVEEFYGMASTFSPSVLISSIMSNSATTQNYLFPYNGTVPSEGPHFYGIGVYTGTNSGSAPFYVTIIRVTLIASPPCTCALAACASNN